MYTVESSPHNVDWGQFDPARDPVFEVESGATLKIQTVTAPRNNHSEILRAKGINRQDILDDELRVKDSVCKTGPGPHIVTGPVAIADATPGDVLEVRIKNIEFRAPYGFNLFKPTGGELAKRFPYEAKHVIPFDIQNKTAQFASNIEIPLDPFLGVMAVCPVPTSGKISTVPPDYFGGNLDISQLGAGSTLYLPVNAERALFWAGDGHGVQGNGEVCLTAAETSLTATFEFVLHSHDARLKWPIAETDEHYIVMGIAQSLDEAMSHGVSQCIAFLSNQTGLNESDAYRLASLCIDFNVSQVVNGNKGIHGLIPKSIFTDDDDIDVSRIDSS